MNSPTLRKWQQEFDFEKCNHFLKYIDYPPWKPPQRLEDSVSAALEHFKTRPLESLITISQSFKFKRDHICDTLVAGQLGVLSNPDRHVVRVQSLYNVHCYRRYDSRDVKIGRQILGAMTQLQDLQLSFEGSQCLQSTNCFKNVLDHLHFSRLQSFELSYVDLYEEEVTDFVQRHRVTLRSKLHLRRCRLGQYQGKPHYERYRAKEVTRWAQLQMLQVRARLIGNEVTYS